MNQIRWTRWRRDLLIGGTASFLTAAVLVTLGQAAILGRRQQAETAMRLALQAAHQAEQKAAETKDQASRDLVNAAADALLEFRGGDRADSDILQVSSDAVAPEVPKGGYLLIDKKAASYPVGDIVVVRVEDKNYLGRVVAFNKAAGRLTIGRNGEANREVAVDDVMGRGVLNSR
ncbi:MAG TPA: S24/S26 family peptidase [Isosphaeraceae bacterium]|jgi:hypothetical protein|nr:S24/S26 family peptidase [Isosphaeraceae bacterium]